VIGRLSCGSCFNRVDSWSKKPACHDVSLNGDVPRGVSDWHTHVFEVSWASAMDTVKAVTATLNSID